MMPKAALTKDEAIELAREHGVDLDQLVWHEEDQVTADVPAPDQP
jgi:hypothetical protein